MTRTDREGSPEDVPGGPPQAAVPGGPAAPVVSGPRDAVSAGGSGETSAGGSGDASAGTSGDTSRGAADVRPPVVWTATRTLEPGPSGRAPADASSAGRMLRERGVARALRPLLAAGRPGSGAAPGPGPVSAYPAPASGLGPPWSVPPGVVRGDGGGAGAQGAGRGWELTVVIDGSLSMAVWTAVVREMIELLGGHEVCRELRAQVLDTDSEPPGDIPGLSRGPSPGRLVLVLTDGLAAAWRSGSAVSLLHAWGLHSPVAVVHLLPAALWGSSGIRAVRTTLRAPAPAAPSASVAWDTAGLDVVAAPFAPTGPGTGVFPVPVLELRERHLNAWARFVAEGADAWRSLFTLLAGPAPPGPFGRGTAAGRPGGSGGPGEYGADRGYGGHGGYGDRPRPVHYDGGHRRPDPSSSPDPCAPPDPYPGPSGQAGQYPGPGAPSGSRVPPRSRGGHREQSVHGEGAESPADSAARERLRDFWSGASPGARELAARLAVAPLNLAVMHRTRSALLPDSGPELLSELFIAGLLRAVSDRGDIGRSDRVTFDFEPRVREHLLTSLERPDTLRAFRSAGTYLARDLGITAVRGWSRLLDDPDGAPIEPPTAGTAPFLRVELAVLDALSGSYRPRARRLREALASSPVQ